MTKWFLISSIILLSAFALPSVSLALEEAGSVLANPTVLKETIEKIANVRKALKLSATTSKACETPSSPNCTFSGYCDKLADKAQSFYLYQDEQDHQVPNFQMLSYVQVAEACARKPFPQAAVNDPFVYPEQLASAEKAGSVEQKKKNLAKYNKELQRARGIFADVQIRITKILESRRTAGNSTEIDNMISRIKTAKFTGPKLGDGIYTLSAEGCESPNAFYDPGKHTVTVCPQFLNLPDAALFTTLSHELGHSIDPCSMVFSYSQGKKGLEMDYPDFMGGDGKKGKAKIAAISVDKNPMSGILACLQTSSSLGVKIPTKESMLSAIDKEEDDLRKEVAADSDSGAVGQEEDGIPRGELGDATMAGFDDSRKAIREHYDTYKNCSSFSSNGHMQEAWSDWVASQTLASKVSEISDSKKAKEYAFTSEAVFLSIGCQNIAQAALNKVKAANGQCSYLDEVSKLMAGLNNEGKSGSDSHPPTDNRVNRLMFVKPEVQNALGCKASSESNGSECK